MSQFALKIITSFLLLATAHAAVAEEIIDELIRHKRAGFGTEETLLNVESMVFTCESFNRLGERISTFELYLKKPYYYKTVARENQFTVTTSTNGFEGYTLSIHDTTPELNSISILKDSYVSFMMASARENLYFLRGPEHSRNGRTVLQGEVVKFGKDCYKVKFEYTSSIYFIRYFEKETYQLVSTVLSWGNTEVLEADYKEFDGITIPTTIKNLTIDGHLISTIKFTDIKFNEPIDDTVFDMPTTIDVLKGNLQR